MMREEGRGGEGLFDFKGEDMIAVVKLVKKELLEIAEPSIVVELYKMLKMMEKLDVKLSDPLMEQVLRETPTLRRFVAEVIYPQVKEIVKKKKFT